MGIIKPLEFEEKIINKLKIKFGAFDMNSKY